MPNEIKSTLELSKNKKIQSTRANSIIKYKLNGTKWQFHFISFQCFPYAVVVVDDKTPLSVNIKKKIVIISHFSHWWGESLLYTKESRVYRLYIFGVRIMEHNAGFSSLFSLLFLQLIEVIRCYNPHIIGFLHGVYCTEVLLSSVSISRCGISLQYSFPFEIKMWY